LTPGVCGCGIPDTDSDKDGTLDCKDQCPQDPKKTTPGQCGCGKPETPGCGTAPSCATNITSQITVTRGGYRRNSATSRYIQQLTVKNGGSSAIQGPVSLVLDTLSSNATLFGATGTTPCATPSSSYVNINVGADNVLSPSESA